MRRAASAPQGLDNSDLVTTPTEMFPVARRCKSYVSCMLRRDAFPYESNPRDSCGDPRRGRNGYCSLRLEVTR